MIGMGRFKSLLENLIFPPKCACCGRMLEIKLTTEAYSALCTDCRRELEAEKKRECRRCSMAMVYCRCMPSALSRAQCVSLIKVIGYDPEMGNAGINRYLYTVKHNACRLDIRFSAEQLRARLIDEMRTLSLTPEDCVITYLPRSHKNKAKYGYDQGELLANELSRITGIPLVVCFSRVLSSDEQKSLSKFERRMNMNSSYLPLEVGDRVRDKTVILVDDIVTTGASMASCVRILDALGAYATVGLCLARTVKKKK